ncbi:hypothetical protein [Mycobacterium lentiflavum]|nr:hypothetical protein [Mycobacterium lentiflavum]
MRRAWIVSWAVEMHARSAQAGSGNPVHLVTVRELGDKLEG